MDMPETSEGPDILDVLEELLLYWSIEGKLKRRIRHLFMVAPEDPAYREKIIEKCMAFDERFRPGTINADLVEAWKESSTHEQAYYAAERIANKIGNPVSRKNTGEYIKTMDLLKDRYEYAGVRAIKKETTLYLLTPGYKKKNGKAPVMEQLPNGGVIIPFWIPFLFSGSPQKVVNRIRKLLEVALYKDFLGDGYRKKVRIDPHNKAISLNTPIAIDEDGNELTLEDITVDKRWDRNLERYVYNNELYVLFGEAIKRARLTKEEEKVIKMLYYDEHEPHEIASLLNKSAGSVYALTSKALEKLRDVFDIKELKEEPAFWAFFYS